VTPVPLRHFTRLSKLNRKLMASSQFPPDPVREVVAEVASLLKERKESISVAETVRRNCNCLYDAMLELFD
jgi:hypothetical protein